MSSPPRPKQDSSFTCTVCTEPHLEPATTISADPVCPSCIRALFTTSLTSETNYPPRWGRTILDPWDFRHVLDTHFLRAFAAKEREWGCPVGERVYCQQGGGCGEFVGRRCEQGGLARCGECWGWTCLRCLEGVGQEEGDAEVGHVCDPSIEQRLRDRAFAGLQRGRDWQQCPNTRCQRRIELMEGCNHVVCPFPCGTSFCYCCGRTAHERSGHWDYGGCPRYGQPGDRRPVHSEDVIEVIEGDDAEHELEDVVDEDQFRWRMQIGLENLARRERDLEFRRQLYEATQRRQAAPGAPIPRHHRRSRQGEFDRRDELDHPAYEDDVLRRARVQRSDSLQDDRHEPMYEPYATSTEGGASRTLPRQHEEEDHWRPLRQRGANHRVQRLQSSPARRASTRESQAVSGPRSSSRRPAAYYRARDAHGTGRTDEEGASRSRRLHVASSLTPDPGFEGRSNNAGSTASLSSGRDSLVSVTQMLDDVPPQSFNRSRMRRGSSGVSSLANQRRARGRSPSRSRSYRIGREIRTSVIDLARRIVVMP